MELFELVGRIILNDEASDKLDNIDQKGASVGERFSQGAGTMAKWGAAAVGFGAAAAGAVVGVAMKTAAYGDELAKTSTKMGVSVEQLQDWRFWAEQNGISSQSLERGMGRLNQRIGVAITEGGKYADALDTLGVAYQNADGSARDTNDVMADTIRTLQGIEDPALQSAMAAELFGTKMARDLMPALQDGSLTIDEATAAMDGFGRMSTEQAQQAEQMNDMINEVKHAFMGMALAIGSEVVPIVITMVAKFQEYLPVIQKLFSTVFGVIQQVAEIFIGVVMRIVDAVDNWARNNTAKLGEIRGTFDNVLNAIVGLIQVFVRLAGSIWDKYGEEIVATIKFAWDVISTTVKTALDLIAGIIKTVTAVIEGDWSAAWEGIKSIFAAVWEGIRGLVEAALNYILSFVGTNLNQVAATIDNVLSSIRGTWESVWNTIRSVVTQIWEGIKSAVSTAINAMRATIESVVNTIKGVIQNGFNAIEGFIMGPINAATGAAVRAFEWMASAISGIVGGIANTISGIMRTIDNARTSVSNFVSGAARRISSVIPGQAEGGITKREGLSWVGEEGPELMHMPRGAVVAPLDKLAFEGGGNNITFGRGAFDGAFISNDYGVDRLMERVVKRLRNETGLKI